MIGPSEFIGQLFIIALLVVLAIFVIVVIVRAIRIVPQAYAGVVERLGKYHKTLQPGLNLLVPFIDRMRPLVDMREQVVSFPPQPVITEDNLVVSIDTVVYFQVTDARAATYEIANYLAAVEQLTTTTLRNVVGGLNLEEALTSRDNINGQLRVVLDEATGKWGIRVNRVELKAIDPPVSIQDSMEKQMRAERDRRAAILTAEGTKQSQILEAEGRRQAEILKAEGDAKAQVLRAQAEAEARLQQLQHQLESTTSRAEYAEQTMLALYASTSWRISAPLRGLKRIGRVLPLPQPPRPSVQQGKQAAGSLFQWTVRKVLAHPGLTKFALGLLARHPGLKARLRRAAVAPAYAEPSHTPSATPMTDQNQPHLTARATRLLSDLQNASAERKR